MTTPGSGTITEMGFSISHVFEGGKASKTLKKISVKEWLGADAEATVCSTSSSGDGGYETLTIGSKTYENAKILDYSTGWEDGALFASYNIEQMLPGDCDICLCEGVCFKSDEIESFSEVVSTSRDGNQVSYERSFSLSFADRDSIVSAPESPTGSALIDRAVNGIKIALTCCPDFTSSDEDIQSLISDSCGDACDTSGRTKKSRSESIDRGSCSVEISESAMRDISDQDCCNISESVNVNISETGLVSISLSGSIKGNCEEFSGCGEGRTITKTKYEFAEDCYDELDTEAKLGDEYDKWKGSGLDACEEDVCLAFMINSESRTDCKEEGTISYSMSGAEEEKGAGYNGTVHTSENTTKQGCVSSMRRSFEIEVPVNQDFTGEKKEFDVLNGDASCWEDEVGVDEETAIAQARSKLPQVDFSAPADFFGPLTFSVTECKSKGTIKGSLSFSNDPKNDTDVNGVIKKSETITTVCRESTRDKKYKIPCNSTIMQKIDRTPGSTRVCKSVQAFPCATLDEVLEAVEIDVPDGAVIVDETSGISVDSGSKSGNKCVKYHTRKDLRQCGDEIEEEEEEEGGEE